MSCNGSGLREMLLKQRSYESEDSAASSKRKADVEKWALLLAAGAAQAQSTAPTLGHVPDGWRGNVEEMTPANGGEGHCGTSGPVRDTRRTNSTTATSDADAGRLQVRVNIGELGELALVLEHSSEGVKIQISAQDRRILEMMALEQDALAAALSGIGDSIASLSFVPMHRIGTKLAQPRVTSQPSKPKRDDDDSSQQAGGKRKSRGLNVIG